MRGVHVLPHPTPPHPPAELDDSFLCYPTARCLSPSWVRCGGYSGKAGALGSMGQGPWRGGEVKKPESLTQGAGPAPLPGPEPSGSRVLRGPAMLGAGGPCAQSTGLSAHSSTCLAISSPRPMNSETPGSFHGLNRRHFPDQNPTGPSYPEVWFSVLDQRDRPQLANASLALLAWLSAQVYAHPLPSEAPWPSVIFLAPEVCLLCLLRHDLLPPSPALQFSSAQAPSESSTSHSGGGQGTGRGRWAWQRRPQRDPTCPCTPLPVLTPARPHSIGRGLPGTSACLAICGGEGGRGRRAGQWDKDQMFPRLPPVISQNIFPLYQELLCPRPWLEVRGFCKLAHIPARQVKQALFPF